MRQRGVQIRTQRRIWETHTQPEGRAGAAEPDSAAVGAAASAAGAAAAALREGTMGVGVRGGETAKGKNAAFWERPRPRTAPREAPS